MNAGVFLKPSSNLPKPPQKNRADEAEPDTSDSVSGPIHRLASREACPCSTWIASGFGGCGSDGANQEHYVSHNHAWLALPPEQLVFIES